MRLTLYVLIFFVSTEAWSQKTDTVQVDTIAYGLGMMQALDLKKQGFDSLNLDDYISGFEAVMVDENEAIMKLGEARTKIKEYIESRKAELSKRNLEEGQAFLEENAKREEITVTESGLQYEVLKEGEGPVPDAASKVTTHYTGKLIDGTVFDSSVERGEPISFPVGGVIKGWQEALQLMPQGSKWKLYIPYELAYGARGAGGGRIPPYSTLIFEIELIDVE
ncbi:MAG: FKBP-type peptidyl-prolyl cis-trans isomerase [Saprospiraceae bacterium]|nr:FKBP-type peptidyl-prolyl cis-trans isomerase [Saprospiraceae bacterium]